MPAEDEDEAYRRLAASFGDAWAGKGTRIAVALTKAAAVKAAQQELQTAPDPQDASFDPAIKTPTA